MLGEVETIRAGTAASIGVATKVANNVNTTSTTHCREREQM
jgi:hypothetical protein